MRTGPYPCRTPQFTEQCLSNLLNQDNFANSKNEHVEGPRLLGRGGQKFGVSSKPTNTALTLFGTR
jgi:hypothetical protein